MKIYETIQNSIRQFNTFIVPIEKRLSKSARMKKKARGVSDSLPHQREREAA
jgi:hypothetical protein